MLEGRGELLYDVVMVLDHCLPERFFCRPRDKSHALRAKKDIAKGTPVVSYGGELWEADLHAEHGVPGASPHAESATPAGFPLK